MPPQTIPALLEENRYLRTANHGLLKQNTRLGEENRKWSDRLLQLEERLNTNSNNSSTAPSQDPFRKTRQLPSSGRKPGGQPGHLGHMRKMVPSDQITRIIEIRSETCPRCGTEISEFDSIAARHHQVVELALAYTVVTHCCNADQDGSRTFTKCIRARTRARTRARIGYPLNAYWQRRWTN